MAPCPATYMQYCLQCVHKKACFEGSAGCGPLLLRVLLLLLLSCMPPPLLLLLLLQQSKL